MKFIAHRGNLYGPDKDKENKPETIEEAIRHGFDCEIDVWYIHERFYLGHDYPETPISLDFLTNHLDRLWIHCKHIDSLIILKDKFNCFYHDKDIYTITTKGFIWGNINSPCNKHIIQVMPEKSGVLSSECCGVCTDFPFRYLKLNDIGEELRR